MSGDGLTDVCGGQRTVDKKKDGRTETENRSTMSDDRFPMPNCLYKTLDLGLDGTIRRSLKRFNMNNRGYNPWERQIDGEGQP